MGKKKAVKKKKVVKKKVVKKKKAGGLVAVEKQVILRTTLNKAMPGGAENVKTKKVGVTVFPAGVPLSKVRVKTHGTFNMGNYNSIQASAEIEDVTLSNPAARKDLFRALSKEALDLNVQLAQQVAKRLFNQDLDTSEGNNG